MARIRSDIPYGYDDTSRVGFWAPETPEFLDKRDARRAAQYQSATSYSQAKATIRRVSLANQEQSARSRNTHAGQARIVDFEQLERARRGGDGAHGFSGGRRGFDDWAESLDDGFAGEHRRARRQASSTSRARRSRASNAHADARRAVAPSRMQHSPYRASGNFDAYGEPAPWDENGEYDEYEERGTRSIAERLRKARHDRRHRKADRAFSRDYAEEIPANEGPRAAVYRGKMGRQHQRAARMQSQGSRFTLKMPAFLAGIIQALSLDRIVFRPWFAVTAVTVFCVVIMATNVYPAAQDYYLQMRSNDQLAAEYQAILDRNAELEDHVAALQTDEGMEELAHESLGWVREGENSVSVLTDGSADPGTSSLAETESVVEGSVPAPETWYSPFLDAVFGYEG